MTRLRRLATALLVCAGFLLAFSSTALPYRSVVDQQIIPDGADDLDYARVSGGGSPSPIQVPGIQDYEDPTSSNMTAVDAERGPTSVRDLLGVLRVSWALLKIGVSAL